MKEREKFLSSQGRPRSPRSIQHGGRLPVALGGIILKMMENALKNNFSWEQSNLQLETEGILAQSFRLGKSFQEGYKTGKLSHALEEDLAQVTKNSETSLSRNVHYLICECFEQLDADARFNDTQNEENSLTDHEAGHLIWEKITEVLGEGNLSLTYL